MAMDNKSKVIISCVPRGNYGDNDAYNGSAKNRSGSIDDYEALFHELSSDQIDNSIAAFLTHFDPVSRPPSPQNIEVYNTSIVVPEPPITINGTITPATVATVNTSGTAEKMRKVDKLVHKKLENHNKSKQQPNIKETELKCKRRICRIDGCERTVKSQGVCQRHGAKTKCCRMNNCHKQAQGNFDGMCST